MPLALVLRATKVMRHDDRHDDKVPADAPEAERVSRHTSDTNLGYAESAGHPGGEPDLENKTESEAEHDESA